MAKHRWLYAWGLGSVAFGAASLLVPLYVVNLGGNPFELGLLGAVSAFLGTPGAIVWGRLADRTQKKRAIVLGSLVGVAAVLGIFPVLSSIGIVIAANALLWLTVAAAGPVLTLLVVAGVSEAEWNREIALLNTYQGYGWAGGLVLGLLWNLTVGTVLSPLAAQRALFVVCAVSAGIAAVLLVRWMPTPPEQQLNRIDSRRIARILSRRRRNVKGATFLFMPSRLYWTTRSIRPSRLIDRFTPTLATYFVATILFFTGFAAFFAPLPLFLTEGAGYTSDLVFGFYLVSSVGSAAFYTGAGRLSSTYDLRLLQTGALGLRAITMPTVAIVGATLAASLLGMGLTAVAFGLIGISWAVIAVTAGTIVTRVAPDAVRGEALGVYTALSTFAGGVGSILGGWLARAFGFTLAFAIAGSVIFVGAVFVALLRSLSTQTGSSRGETTLLTPETDDVTGSDASGSQSQD